MIRMGRNSKPEPPKHEPSNKDFTTTSQALGYGAPTNETAPYRSSGEYVPAQNRALTDSESMARDIKEGRLSGFVGSGTMLTGETAFKAMLRVDGHLTGIVTSETGTLIIGTTGQVDANITVAAAVVHGTVNGDIVATERIELGRTAKVVGNIQTPSISIEQGAIFEGNCSMVRQKAEMEKRAAAREQQQTQARSVNYETAGQPDELEVDDEMPVANSAV